MNNDMTEKYQQHYNQILSGTLNDLTMKSISYQANIKLANEIIADQDKELVELKDTVNVLKKENENLKTGKTSSENLKISSLENNIKTQLETISKLNVEISNASRLKVEYESLKNQVANLEVFRKELIKERENHESTKKMYELKIKELNDELELLKSPSKRKKTTKRSDLLEIVENNEVEENTQEIVKDGGIF